MDTNRFDAWTVAIATLGSRRTVLRAAVAGVVAAAVGTSRVRRAGAVNNGDAKCSQDSDCDAGICFTTDKCKKKSGRCRCNCTQTTDCPAGKLCCDLGFGVGLCRADLTGSCSFDTDCCNSLCRNGACCLPSGRPCTGNVSCCSGICDVGSCT